MKLWGEKMNNHYFKLLNNAIKLIKHCDSFRYHKGYVLRSNTSDMDFNDAVDNLVNIMTSIGIPDDDKAWTLLDEAWGKLGFSCAIGNKGGWEPASGCVVIPFTEKRKKILYLGEPKQRFLAYPNFTKSLKKLVKHPDLPSLMSKRKGKNGFYHIKKDYDKELYKEVFVDDDCYLETCLELFFLEGELPNKTAVKSFEKDTGFTFEDPNSPTNPVITLPDGKRLII